MKINKEMLLLTILFFLSEILDVEVLFILVLFLILFKSLKRNIPYKILKVNFNFIIIVLLGMIVGLIYIGAEKYGIRDYIRDIFRIGTPFLFISYGIYMFKFFENNKYLLYKSVVYGGILISIRHFMLILININKVISTGTTRGYGGLQSGTTILALVILLFNKKDDIKKIIKSNFNRCLIIFVLLTSMLLYFSRTDIIVFMAFVILFAINKFLKFLKSGINIGRVGKVIFILLIGISICYAIIPKAPIENMINKFANSVNEVSANRVDNWTYSDINTDWRGYEVYRAKLEYKNANLIQKFIGFGFGKKVSLGLTMKLGDYSYNAIPILHNGYYYLLIKTGIVGVMLFLLFIFKNFAYNFCLMIKNKKQFESMMLSGICLWMLLSTYVVTGAFNPKIAFSFFVLFGYLVIYIQNTYSNK